MDNSVALVPDGTAAEVLDVAGVEVTLRGGALLLLN